MMFPAFPKKSPIFPPLGILKSSRSPPFLWRFTRSSCFISILAQFLSLSKTMKRCKILRNEAVVNEDRISQLPEALLLHILSSLPTKDVVATSVLSKQWKFLWKLVPKLKFIYEGTDDIERFSDNVCRTLLSHKAPFSFHLALSFFYQGESMDLGLLLGIAFGLRVRKLKLEVHYAEEPFKFPRSLFYCETLETLKLASNIILDVPFPVCLKSLRTLHLDDVIYKDDESVVNFLSGCSSLEELLVHQSIEFDVNTFTIAVPSLKRLTITGDNEYDEEYSIYMINAPSLKYLKIGGIQDAEPCLLENTPELEEANLSLTGMALENILGSLGSVKRLSLHIASHMKIKFPAGSFFYQLVSLELHTYDPKWRNLLTLMLDNSPKLQVLRLITESFRKGDRVVAYRKWSRPKYVPECLLLHLETFVWKNFQGETSKAKKVAKYILRHAKHLKTATFSKTFIDPEKRHEMLEELESVVRASNSCQIVVKDCVQRN